MENKFHISVSPHIHRKRTTTGIMLDVIIALLPAVIAATIIFSWRVLLLVGVCVATCSNQALLQTNELRIAARTRDELRVRKGRMQ